MGYKGVIELTYTWLVTGTSRGIGLEIVKLLVASPVNTVFAACRNPSSATSLKALKYASMTKGTLHLIKMDVTDEASVQQARDEVEDILDGQGLDYLFNNAGVAIKDDRPSTMNADDLTSTILANVIGPALVTRTFIPLVERSQRKVIANVSTALASIGTDYGPQHLSYSISKIALNMLTYKQVKERPDLCAVLVDPGWVKTDMGGSSATLEASESAAGMVRVVIGVTPEDTGKFIDYTGKEIPW